jgi:hypothetical protein
MIRLMIRLINDKGIRVIERVIERVIQRVIVRSLYLLSELGKLFLRRRAQHFVYPIVCVCACVCVCVL